MSNCIWFVDVTVLSYGQIRLTGTATPACLPQKIKVVCTSISLKNQGTVCGKMEMCRVRDTPPKDMEYLLLQQNIIFLLVLLIVERTIKPFPLQVVASTSVR